MALIRIPGTNFFTLAGDALLHRATFVSSVNEILVIIL
jgi:hypothetical protein